MPPVPVLPPFPFVEEISTFMRGLVMGVVVAAPVGPVGLLCIRRTLQSGFLSGLVTGLGAAFADGFFAVIAAFGITAALTLVEGMEKEIRLFGGLFLVVMALATIMRKVHIRRQGGKGGRPSLVAHFMSGLIITLSNPLTIIGVLAVVAAFGGSLDVVRAGTLVAGIFCGSAAWWLALCGGSWLVRSKVGDDAITWINRGTAVLILLLGGWAFYTGLAAILGLPV